jgi:hypothetical protein
MRRRIAVLLMTVMMLGVMPAAPALAVSTHVNEGHKLDDGGDKNQGGGQEHPKNQNHQNGRVHSPHLNP